MQAVGNIGNVRGSYSYECGGMVPYQYENCTPFDGAQEFDDALGQHTGHGRHLVAVKCLCWQC